MDIHSLVLLAISSFHLTLFRGVVEESLAHIPIGLHCLGRIYHVCQADGRSDTLKCPKWTRFNNYLGICDWHFKAWSPNMFESVI